MTIQIQKEDFIAAGEFDVSWIGKVLAWAPAAELVQGRYDRWEKAQAKAQAKRMVHALADALELVTARVEREPARKAYATAVRRRAKLDRSRIAEQVQAEAVRDLNGEDVAALVNADQLEARAAVIGTADKTGRMRRTAQERKAAASLRAQALALRTGVERRRARAMGLSRTEQHMREIAALETLREGEADVIETTRGQAQRRVRTRDGLKLIHERGGLDADGEASRWTASHLLAVGLRYRDRYELAQAALKSCLDISDRTRVQVSMWEAANRAHRRAASANQVRQLEIAVVTQLGEEALDVLRQVAGEARTIRSMASGGKRRERLAALLRSALGIIATHIEKAG